MERVGGVQVGSVTQVRMEWPVRFVRGERVRFVGGEGRVRVRDVVGGERRRMMKGRKVREVRGEGRW